MSLINASRLIRYKDPYIMRDIPKTPDSDAEGEEEVSGPMPGGQTNSQNGPYNNVPERFR